jgi:putative chitobiose transport system permease protein
MSVNPLRFVGLANLERLLSDPMARQVLVTTFFYLVRCGAAHRFGGAGAGGVGEPGLPGRSCCGAPFYTPVLVSIVVAAIAFRWLYAENGLINGWLSALLGDAFSPIGFLTTPQLALPAVMLVTLWKGLGYYMVIFWRVCRAFPRSSMRQRSWMAARAGESISTSPCP